MTLRYSLYLSVFSLIFISPLNLAAEDLKSEALVQNALKNTEKTGVKIGMHKEEVLKLLGKSYVEENVNAEVSKDKVYTWHKDSNNRISVTFAGDKVKAISNLMPNKDSKKEN